MAYIGSQPTVGNFQACDAISATATATFNLTVGNVAISPQSAQHCLVSLNGILQAPISSYTISGSTIVFAAALTTDDSIDFITVLGDVLDLGVPSDDTVGAAQIKADLISGTTALAAEPADTDEFLVSDAGVLKRIDYSLIKGGGKIGQVVSAVKTDVFSMSANSYADVTGVTVNITPSATSSKVLVFCSGVYGKTNNDNFNHQILRASTSIIENKVDNGLNTNFTDVFSLQVLDAPSSTSQLTYKLQIKNDGNDAVTINRNVANTTDRGNTTITVMEVLA